MESINILDIHIKLKSGKRMGRIEFAKSLGVKDYTVSNYIAKLNKYYLENNLGCKIVFDRGFKTYRMVKTL